ncbi:hypothetical protein [Halarcobacter bivalviorum]|uniref:Uncharacterized protein n=1 Tax=Halarcobacter bivalviorum TaxID=663364 RepID=A0AAX2A5D9_9BACT|nr:hypothetical protein [Halarcobacter bivalviorum]AXH13046.1 hypothetical protein ABIV_2071 [Halarcobacter bivalviorum]RXK09150.1 hypothetical protein CRV05_11220 [Halarcobacter bivalviorum]
MFNDSQIQQLSKAIDQQRVKTKGREATLLVPPLWALNATLQLGHTIMTWDPDWVIYKNLFGSKIEVKYFGKDA